MIFKHPALLYALFFLLIPIIVHLFQLRKFSKVEFSNVAFLKPLISQTRKSRTLKKWLTLLSRLAALAAIIIAFAQPFLPSNIAATQEKKTLIYLDNSDSMQAAGENGSLLNEAVTDLIKLVPKNSSTTLFTNDKVYKNKSNTDLTNILTSLKFTGNQLTLDQVQLKAQSLVSSYSQSQKELVLISDFQKGTADATLPDTLVNWSKKFVKLQAQEFINISIDTAYISKRTTDEIELSIELSSNKPVESPVSITIKDKDLLVAKSTVDLSTLSGKALIDLNATNRIAGTISINDPALQYDNTLYFNTGKPTAIKVLSINGTDDAFLKKIYTAPEFTYLSNTSANLNFNNIKEQQVIIINELKEVSTSLIQAINSFTNSGGTLIVIPPAQATATYDKLSALRSQTLAVKENEKKVSQINFNHPLFTGVFNKRIKNFQYPSINKTSYDINGGNSILKYDDNSNFLLQRSRSYIFTAALNTTNSNFQNSPLIVPVFYNIGISSMPLPSLYYNLESDNEVAIATTMESDNILSLKNNNVNIIPRQRSYDKFVLLNVGNDLSVAGNYDVLKTKQPIDILSFNNTRSENSVLFFSDADFNQLNSFESVGELFLELDKESYITYLWKYFLILGLLFLIIEMLLLKFLK